MKKVVAFLLTMALLLLTSAAWARDADNSDRDEKNPNQRLDRNGSGDTGAVECAAFHSAHPWASRLKGGPGTARRHWRNRTRWARR